MAARGDAGREHGQHEDAPDQVTGDHDGAAGKPVGEAGQEHPAKEIRHEAGRERDRGEQRGLGAVVDEERQRYEGDAVAARRQDVGDPEGAELGMGEDIAEGRTAGRRQGHGATLSICWYRPCMVRRPRMRLDRLPIAM